MEMTKKDILQIAERLFDVFNEDEVKEFISYANNEYFYGMTNDFNFFDIVNEFHNDIEIKDSEMTVLSIIVMFHSEDVIWYDAFEMITGTRDHRGLKHLTKGCVSSL